MQGVFHLHAFHGLRLGKCSPGQNASRSKLMVSSAGSLDGSLADCSAGSVAGHKCAAARYGHYHAAGFVLVRKVRAFFLS